MTPLTPTVAATWAWIAVLVLATITVHVLGIALIARSLRRFWTDDVDRELTFFDSGPGAIAIIVVIAFTLALFHGIEALIWALAYFKLGVFSSMNDAMLYSLGSMTTRGSAGFRLQPGWALMGAAEAGDGMLLFGISTAFLFTVMVRLRRIVASPS
jgi:hypothetical protein